MSFGSQELFDYVKSMGVAVFDLLVGYTAGQILDVGFDCPALIPIAEMGGFWKVLGLVVAECALTATVLVALRKLMYPPGMDDLTGGMYMMQAIMHQGAFWSNLEALWEFGYGKVRRAPAVEAGNPSDVGPAVAGGRQ